jgi:leucyl-tRNA synthetase
MGYNFTVIEQKWQRFWLDNKTFAALDPQDALGMRKAYILDMFPYPSGSGLHVGHPEGYTATDIVSRYLRAQGYNVLHPMGWDAFGLPAEQYAIKNNVHPSETTQTNIKKFREQIQSLGLSYDWDREVDTTDPGYYKWTQWIFLQLFNSYFDPADNKAKPISHLIAELENENYVVAPDGSVHINPTTSGLGEVTGEIRVERLWRELNASEQRDVLDGQRLAYMDEIPVNWCPGLGTVLANEEVIDGKSEVGGYPVERRPLRQWMLRITEYADRLIDDLSTLEWPESLKEMQRNWIGKSIGAEIDFDVADTSDPEGNPFTVTVFTTRPDTLYGATYMVLAPEHELVDQITPASHSQAVAEYRAKVTGKSDRDRIADTKDKTGVFTGAFAINPINDEKIPVYVADYVLMGYGTGAIMAVPAHDERDYEFAQKFGIPLKYVVTPIHGELPTHKAYVGEGIAINSPIIDGMTTERAKEEMIRFLEIEEVAFKTTKFKLRDWLFSRQRYWGEPFPIVLDREGNAYDIPETELPLTLPKMEDFKPTGTPEPPLSKMKDWITYSRGEQTFTRETNTMPQWAGSCWYYLRYIDPKNTERFVDPEKEKYWMPVDLYVGGVEHAVLHLLYARFWHKVLFDLGYVSTAEPFGRLVNQGLILGEVEYRLWFKILKTSSKVGWPDIENVSVEHVSDSWTTMTEEQEIALGNLIDQGHADLTSTDTRTGETLYPQLLSAEQVVKRGAHFYSKEHPEVRIHAQAFKMSKSRGNVVNPDSIVKDYGADTFRLYEMYMGPLEQQKPWNTRDIVGMSRFLSSVYRNLIGEDPSMAETPAAGAPTHRMQQIPIPETLDRMMHRTIKKVAEDIVALRFNTAIAELIKLNNELIHLPAVPRELAENFILMLAPFAPHLAEELWSHLGHHKSLARRPWPTYDPAKLVESTLDIPVQVNGKLRDVIKVDVNASESDVLALAATTEKIIPYLSGKTIKKQLYVPKKLVNFVV